MTVDEARATLPGTKVRFQDTTYDFGYVGATGKAILYEEDECNAQDSFAVDPSDLTVDEAAGTLAADAGWLLIEAYNLLLEVPGDRAAAWIDRFKKAMVPMIQRQADTSRKGDGA